MLLGFASFVLCHLVARDKVIMSEPFAYASSAGDVSALFSRYLLLFPSHALPSSPRPSSHPLPSSQALPSSYGPPFLLRSPFPPTLHLGLMLRSDRTLPCHLGHWDMLTPDSVHHCQRVRLAMPSCEHRRRCKLVRGRRPVHTTGCTSGI